MKHTHLILFAAALLVAGCHRHIDTHTTLIPDAVTDIDGNTYKTVKIGEQVWMAENMRATHDRDGKKIALGSKNSAKTPYRYCPRKNSQNVEKYGYLYNWKAAKRLCPKGWHLPTEKEWTQLTDYVSSQSQYVCGDDKENIAKALASKEGWKSCDGPCTVGNEPNDNNTTGFNALPAGGYYTGGYSAFGYDAVFWGASENYCQGFCNRGLCYGGTYVSCLNYNKHCGFSVRCVRD